MSTGTSRSGRLTSFLIVMTLGLSALLGVAAHGPNHEEHGPYFGADNIPTACKADMVSTNPEWWRKASNTKTVCHHMRTDMNGLDSPEVDVLIMVPVSPAAERDMRIIRQAIETWEQGIDYIARQLNMDWLAEGMNFHVTVDAVDMSEGGEFTTYPIVDPEIVVIASNPVGGIGIGIDPIDFFPFGTGGQGPCHGLTNPFDHEAWENVPGFDSHHEERSGTYKEDCDGKGGNICFAVNGAIDPTPGTGALKDFFPLFDLVTHEVGHCLTIGHVGDGAEGKWGGLPKNDIMAYNTDPVNLYKCVSTLNVEGIATVMSRYLDVNGDGKIDTKDHLLANDRVGDGRDVFQVQRPDEHLYASANGKATSCPQPDVGLVPGKRVSFTPATDWPAGLHGAQYKHP